MSKQSSEILFLNEKISNLERKVDLLFQLNSDLKFKLKKKDMEILNLKKENKKLKKKIEKLTVKPNQPSGSKPDYEKDNSKTNYSIPGQKLGHKGMSRKSPMKIHEKIEYKVDCCKYCQSTSLTDFQQRSKIITDIEFRIINLKENYYDMKCLSCGEITKPQSLHGKSKSPFGKTIQTLTAYLTSVCGTTKRPTENLFRDFFGVEISDTSLINAEIRNSKELLNEYNKYLELVKEAQFSHKDETSYRVGGKTNWIWVYDSIKHVFYRLAKTRGKQVLIDDFGLDQNQISINDCYSSYNMFKNRQICWAHILRECEFHSKKEDSTNEEKRFYTEILQLYKETLIFLYNDPPSSEREKARADFENQLCKIMLSIKIQTDFLRRIFKRLNNNLMHCFLFVEVKNLPSTNNQAERSIRPLVCHRKVSFGSKSWDGGQAKMIFKTIFENAKRQKKQLNFALNTLFYTSNAKITIITT